jgi:hypothetical protein
MERFCFEPVVYYDRSSGDTVDGYAVYDRLRGISRKSLSLALCERVEDAERIADLLNEKLTKFG